VKANVVEKSGAWFSYDSQRIGQGRENAKQFLKENPDVASKIEAAVRQNAGLIVEAIMAGEGESKDDDDQAPEAWKDDGLPGGVVATLPSGAGLREDGIVFSHEEPAQERTEPLPALPAPTQLVEGQGIAEPIAEPKAAKPRKAGPAKGNAKTAYAKSQL